jgi:solute carrier family 25 oxoglutarate transporter 11
MSAQEALQRPLPNYLQFVFGGLAGMGATLIVQPFDVVKTRMQLSQAIQGVRAPGPFQVLRGIVATEGATKLYAGLSAGLFRQVTYTTTRLGVYGVLLEELTRLRRAQLSKTSTGESTRQRDETLPFSWKAAAGLAAGAIGALVGTPAEVALIRMMADGRLPVERRRNYHSVFDALLRIVREEGVLTLWRGALPTVGRAALLNMAQLGTYSQAKEMILGTGLVGDHLGTHILASTVSGFAATCVSLPLDNAKTKLQQMQSREYKGMLEALIKTSRNEGIPALWRGFLPYFLRLTPHTIGAFVLLEQLKRVYSKYRMSL